MKLHQQFVTHHTAVHFEFGQFDTGILVHGFNNVAGLIGTGLQDRACDVALVYHTGQDEVESLFAALARHAGSIGPEDDATAVVIRW